MGAQATSTEIVVRGVCCKQGRILVCRSVEHGHAFLPGGHVEDGETVRDGLAREWLEELGVPCRVGDFLGVAEQHYRSAHGVWTQELSLVFAVRCAALHPRKPVAVVEPHIRFEWIELGLLRRRGVLPPALIQQLPRWLRHGPGFISAVEDSARKGETEG